MHEPQPSPGWHWTTLLALRFLFAYFLLAFAVAIAAPGLPRLAGMFVLNRPVPPADLRGPWTDRSARRIASCAKCAWQATALGVMPWETRKMQRTYISRENRGFRWINEYPFNR
jgi:hypothetical protein